MSRTKTVKRKRWLPCLRDMEFVRENIKRFNSPFYGGQLTTYREPHIRRWIEGTLTDNDLRMLRFERRLALSGGGWPVSTLDAQRMSESRHRTPL